LEKRVASEGAHDAGRFPTGAAGVACGSALETGNTERGGELLDEAQELAAHGTDGVMCLIEQVREHAA
jgi:hypothetical protein